MKLILTEGRLFRRSRLWIWVTLLGFFAACSPVSKTQEPGDVPEPNLILIIADDMAWDDCGAYGHPRIQTPNLDRMAREGLRFDRAFLTTSSCSPSRSSIITGMYPHQTDAEQLHWPLPGYNLTFVELLKEAGYWTAQAGKWHLGPEVKDRFDLVREGGSEEDRALRPRDGSGAEDWVQTLRDAPEEHPFFLWLAAVDPHRGYRDSIIASPHSPKDVRIPPYMPDTRDVRLDFGQYYDEISRLDAYVGRVVAELEEQGKAENTLVLFISDNGRPFPRDKTTLYEGGIRTPMIAWWPGVIGAGRTTDALVSSIDIAPTFLELAGVSLPQSMEGISQRALFMGEEGEALRSFVVAEDHWHDFDDFGRAIRTQDFKYIRNYYPELPNTPPADALNGGSYAEMHRLKQAGGLDMAQMRIFESPRPQEELYKVSEDPYELNNLVEDPNYGHILGEMRGILLSWREKTRDTVPSIRTPDEFDRATGERFPIHKMPRKSNKTLLYHSSAP